MTRVHFVKKALKDNPVAKKGESYYWWSFRFGGKRYSKTPPRPSMLTQSEFLSAVYCLQEQIQDASPATMEELEDLVEDWKGQINEIRDGCQERFDNMPEGLQQSDTGSLLEERISEMESWEADLESLDLSREEEEPEEDAVARILDEIRSIERSL